MPNGGPTAIAPTPSGPPPDATTTKYKKSFTESKKWNTYQEEQSEDGGVWKGQLISLTWEKGKSVGKWNDGHVKEEWGWIHVPKAKTKADDDVPRAMTTAKAKTKVTPKSKGKAKGKAKPKAKAKGKAKAKARGRGGN